jgi:hypothetical protein
VIVSHPEDVSGTIEGETPGIYQVQIGAIGDTWDITLEVDPPEKVPLLILAPCSQVAARERYQQQLQPSNK